MKNMPRCWGIWTALPAWLSAGDAGAYIKAFLTAQTAIRPTRAGAVLVNASFSGPDVAGDAEMPQTFVH